VRAEAIAWLVSRNHLFGGEWLRGTVPAQLVASALDCQTAVCDRMGTADPRGPLYFATCGEPPRYFLPRVIIVRPIAEWRPEFTEQAHRAGQIVVADLDDDLWAHEDWTPDSRPNDDHFDDWFWDCDAVICSTSTIARRVRDGVGHRRQKGPVVVAPNCFEPDLLRGAPRPGRVIGTRLWLAARMQADIALYRSVVWPLLDELDLTFFHLGAEDGHRFSDHGFPADRVVEHGSVPEPAMGGVLEAASIGMICVGEHVYNSAKTLTHPLELGAIGLPLVVASSLELYRSVPGFVPPTEQAVRRRLVRLLEPAEWRVAAAETQRWARKVIARDRRRYLDSFALLLGRLELL
jgi:hypothetical protein